MNSAEVMKLIQAEAGGWSAYRAATIIFGTR